MSRANSFPPIGARVAVLLALLCQWGAPAFSGSPAGPGEQPIVKRGLRFYPKSRRIEMDGKIGLSEGPIELLACSKGGKEHESTIVLNVNPEVLHFCLLLMKLKPGKPGSGPRFQGDPKHAPTGSPVEIRVRWADRIYRDADTEERARELLAEQSVVWTRRLARPDGRVEWVYEGLHVARWNPKTRTLIIWAYPAKTPPAKPRTWSARAEDLCWNVIDKRPMRRTHWVFVGSKIVKDRVSGKRVYWANVEKSIITVYRDPYAVLDLPLALSANDEAYVVNKQLVPRRGTPCTVIVTPAKPHRGPERNAAGGRIHLLDVTAGGRILIDDVEPEKPADVLRQMLQRSPRDSVRVTVDHGAPAGVCAAAFDALDRAGARIESVKTVRLKGGVIDVLTLVVVGDTVRIGGKTVTEAEAKAVVAAAAGKSKKAGLLVRVTPGSSLRAVVRAVRAGAGVKNAVLRLAWDSGTNKRKGKARREPAGP